jgi:hypothetical protein
MNNSGIGPPPSKFIRQGKRSKSIGNTTSVQSVVINPKECVVSDKAYDEILMFIMDDM